MDARRKNQRKAPRDLRNVGSNALSRLYTQRNHPEDNELLWPSDGKVFQGVARHRFGADWSVHRASALGS